MPLSESNDERKEVVASTRAVDIKDEGKTRHYTGWMRTFLSGYVAVFSLYSLLEVSGVLRRAGIDIYPLSHNTICFTFIVVYVFLTVPMTRRVRRDRIPWYDCILVALTLITSLYVAFTATRFVEAGGLPGKLEQVLFVITVVLLLEACRRATSWILSVIGVMFFVYPFVASYLPGLLYGKSHNLMELTALGYISNQGIYGHLFHITATVIVVFIIFGSFLRVSGAGQVFTDLALARLGKYKGGPAKGAVLASALFGTINGSAVANVAATGVVTIPLMKSVGYKPYFAGAVEAVASTGGVIMPPVMGATIFVMMDFLGVSYVKMMAVALLPAILYYWALMVMIHLEAEKTGLKGVPRERLPSGKQALSHGWIFFVPLILLLFLLIVMHYSPQTAGTYTIVALVLISLVKKDTRMGPKKILAGLSGGMAGMPEAGTAISLAGLLASAAALTGIGYRLGAGLIDLTGGNLFLLLVATWVACSVLGMALPGIAVYTLGAIILAPALVRSGVMPIAAHFFVLYTGVSAAITPPICIASFVGASIAGAPFMRTGFEACRLGVIVFIVPFVFAYSPQLLMIGEPGEIVLAAITALIGVIFLSFGVQGYMVRRTGWIERILFLAVGIVMIIPGWKLDIATAFVGAILVLWQLRGKLLHRLKTSYVP